MKQNLNVASRWVLDVNKVLRMEDLVKGDDAIFAATGVTDGELFVECNLKVLIGSNTFDRNALRNQVRFVS